MPKGKSSAQSVSKKMKEKKKKRADGEDTDEGDMESREVDYISDSSSGSELEFLVRCSG